MFTKGVAEKPGEEPEEAIITTMSKSDSLRKRRKPISYR